MLKKQRLGQLSSHKKTSDLTIHFQLLTRDWKGKEKLCCKKTKRRDFFPKMRKCTLTISSLTLYPTYSFPLSDAPSLFLSSTFYLFLFSSFVPPSPDFPLLSYKPIFLFKLISLQFLKLSSLLCQELLKPPGSDPTLLNLTLTPQPFPKYTLGNILLSAPQCVYIYSSSSIPRLMSAHMSQ